MCVLAILINYIDGKVCNITKFKNNYYQKITIKEGMSFIFSPVVLRNSNYLFYSCNSRIHWPPTQVRYYDLNTNIDHDIDGTINCVTVAVNNKEDTVLFAGHNHRGIMKFNIQNNTASFLIKASNFVDVLTFGKNLYCSWLHKCRIYEYKNDMFKIVEGLKDIEVRRFIETENGDKYFMSKSKPYKIRTGSNVKVRLSNENIDVRQITEDINGNVYFIGNNSVFEVINDNLEKVAEQYRIQGLAFDKDNNMYYADWDSLIYLKKTDERCPL